MQSRMAGQASPAMEPLRDYSDMKAVMTKALEKRGSLAKVKVQLKSRRSNILSWFTRTRDSDHSQASTSPEN